MACVGIVVSMTGAYQPPASGTVAPFGLFGAVTRG